MSQVGLITGSSRGLGHELAIAALEAGHRVAATARKVSDLMDLQQKYRDHVLPLALDVTNEAQANEAVQSTISTFGRLDVLVNNAGYGNVAPIEDTSLEEFRAQIETNLFGVIILTKAVLPQMPTTRLRRMTGPSSNWPEGGKISASPPISRGRPSRKAGKAKPLPTDGSEVRTAIR